MPLAWLAALLAVDDLLSEMADATRSATNLGLPFRPKAIYISNTNTIDGASIRDDMMRPFKERQARPILIWRHLVEHAGIDPATIAVYCDLRFDPKIRPPAHFNLFSQGDSDYDRFIAGNFRHVIFNLSLQEGWDDPECAFAYIDKDMGSPDQVTQVVGRVLRQPGAQHYPSPNLNTAHFYIRTDEKGIFEAILEDVRAKLASDTPEITLTVRRETHGGSKPYRPTLKERAVPTASIDSTHAKPVINSIIKATQDYSAGGVNTVGGGGRIQILQTIGVGEAATVEWTEVEHSNRVTARWILRREIQRLFQSHGDRQRSPINLCDIEDRKFDAMVEYNSPAADHIRDQARKVVDAYIEHSVILQNALDHPYIVPAIAVDESNLVTFNNALHAGYGGLNKDELAFAKALDKTKRVLVPQPVTGWIWDPPPGSRQYPDLQPGFPYLDRQDRRRDRHERRSSDHRGCRSQAVLHRKGRRRPGACHPPGNQRGMASCTNRRLWQAEWQHRLHGVVTKARQAASDPLHHNRRGRASLPESLNPPGTGLVMASGERRAGYRMGFSDG